MKRVLHRLKSATQGLSKNAVTTLHYDAQKALQHKHKPLIVPLNPETISTKQ